MESRCYTVTLQAQDPPARTDVTVHASSPRAAADAARLKALYADPALTASFPRGHTTDEQLSSLAAVLFAVTRITS